jgi:hypothetical protein
MDRDGALDVDAGRSHLESGTQPPGHEGRPQALIAAAFAVLLLVLAITSQGAFAVSRWAPLGLFALAVLVGALAVNGGIVARSWRVKLALTGIWGLAGWSMLSMTWAQSSGDAWIAGNRVVLYAAIATLPFVLPLSRRSLAAAGWSIAIGIGAIGVYVLLALLFGNTSLFLAGRLNGPVNYRNATALLFAMPFWPLVVAASARHYRRGVRAAALAVATLCLGLAFLTQSRGILIGLVVGGVLALVLGPDRVRRAWLAGISVALTAGASPWLLKPFHAFDGGHGFVTHHSITVAAVGLAIATAAALVLGMAIALFDQGLRANSAQMSYVRGLARGALVAAVVVGVVAAGAAIGNPVTYLQKKWDQFTSLQSTTPTTTRLLTVGGQRYDLWRVALKEFSGAPVGGVGGDNYAFGYYRYRRSNRNLNDPHSLLFSMLSEEGIVGLFLLVTFLAGIGAVVGGRWRTLSAEQRRHAVGPLAAGAVLFGQSTVDWIWLIPGLTAVGIFALAVAGALAAAPAVGESLPSAVPRTTIAGRIGRVAALAGLGIAGLSVLALFLSDAYIQKARTDENSPRAELSAARTAGKFDPWSVTPHYLEASALESAGELSAAYGQLRDALSLEPQNSATLGVLGDFEARRHNFAAARAYYRAALALNPRDTGLQQLVRIGLLSQRPHP